MRPATAAATAPPLPTFTATATATATAMYFTGLVIGGTPYKYIVKYMAVAVAVDVGGGGAVAVAVAGLTKKFVNHLPKDFSIRVWV